MKIQTSYDLSDEGERAEYRDARLGARYKAALQTVAGVIRNKVKYGENPDHWQEFSDAFYAALKDENLDLWDEAGE